ncbi:uncharacterized protein LOC128866874 [Anastrepha ludens]|uniref:uncharacterized protein LOC128866874 n=1 Tax=Anastrepha ludens TaxID=28586 RepID=UPI0023B19C11|nr:uncharacterized protein LOC128866874 [Anastrepha ludens]XP_053963882.1 uncharacterized protein LOC128866874 [Anastrepha ludens]XP_053963883.1 uncharacterized protein LOC128866874 [Anastrepha ludens]XP_053963884.1 uncharacterized protein LOC128866874 [Anastrepha ludens]XP_053963885.1 uncharacterized protein LOC128866874 [Anastrepha ludens]
MDWKEQPAVNDIEQFLRDVREHFRASLETSEYENTSNMFHATEAESTLNLLLRCELLLANYSKEDASKTTTPLNNNQFIVNGKVKSNEVNEGINGGNGVNGLPMQTRTSDVGTQCNNATKNVSKQTQQQHEDASYLDMSGGGKTCGKKSSSWYGDWNNETKSDKTFRCSARLSNKTNSLAYSDDDFDDDEDNEDDSEGDENDNGSQNYDICQVSSHDRDETQKAITPELEPMQAVDCPYMDLPAGHLSIEHATKYGQLQRVEKRLFFDQCKKYYCGVLNDWLLCYADGPTAAHPTVTLYLKHSGIEIEHYGEGKRREVCFQITTADPNKKFLFQANSEVDAKEWIIAVEAAIRGDTSPASNMKSSARKLPTPPIVKKMTFMGHMSHAPIHDCIYEEPSPLFQTDKPHNRPANLPMKKEAFSSLDMANCFEYDVPKCPPQPIKTVSINHTEAETAELLNLSEHSALSAEKIEFQSIVKDVHSKLSSQLSACPTPERLKKAAKKTYSGSSASDVEAVALTPTSPATLKEHKKQRKSTTPNGSPQKSNNSGINNQNNANTNTNTTNNNNACGNERTAVKSWFFNRLNKTTSSGRSTSSSNSNSSSPAKCKQSEKENLLQSLELNDMIDGSGGSDSLNNTGSNPASPILKNPSSGVSAGVDSTMKSKVDLIIKEFETSAHMGILTMETLAGSAVASLSSFCDNDCNNYEPIMTVTTPPNSFLKKI